MKSLLIFHIALRNLTNEFAQCLLVYKFFLFITTLHDKLVSNLPKQNGLFIASCIDPYAEEFLDNTKTIANKLLKLGIPSYRIHASGHAKPHDIINFVKEINPKNLIPIHTEHAELFNKLFENTDINIILPKYGKSIEFAKSKGF